MSRAVIFTGGEFADTKKFNINFSTLDYNICADSGVDQAKYFNIMPDLIIGDMDSIDNLDDYKKCEIITAPTQKDETDTLLAVMEALKRGHKEILVIGGLGGRLDHTFANFSVLKYITLNNAKGTIVGKNELITMVSNDSIVINKIDDTYISVFPFSGVAKGVSLTGVKYPLLNAQLIDSFAIGVSNEFINKTVTISVNKGILLIIICAS